MDYYISLQTLEHNTVPPHDPDYPKRVDVQFFRYIETTQWQNMFNRQTYATIMPYEALELPLIVQFPYEAMVSPDCEEYLGKVALHFYMIIGDNRYSTPDKDTAYAFLEYCGYTVPDIDLEDMVSERVIQLESEGR